MPPAAELFGGGRPSATRRANTVVQSPLKEGRRRSRVFAVEEADATMRLASGMRAKLLALCLVFVMAGCAQQTPAVSATNTATEAPAPSASGVSTVMPKSPPALWFTWIEPTYGYQLDLPGYVSASSTGGFGVGGEQYSWQAPTPRQPQQVTSITVSSATQVHASDCTPGPNTRTVTIGSGITGTEDDSGVGASTPAPNSGSPGSRIIATFASNGVYVKIELLAVLDQGQTFQQEYGATWSHILASFQTGSTSFGSGNPCATATS